MFTSLSAPREDCPEKLPNPPKPTLSHKRNLFDQPVNDLQMGMLQTASFLHGKKDDISLFRTEKEAV
jgi:hypothetical protein